MKKVNRITIIFKPTKLRLLYLMIFTLLLEACAVGPNYTLPTVDVPINYKEGSRSWKPANPQLCGDTPWWEIFNDPELNQLEQQVNISNQNIAEASAQYLQARALVAQARSAFFPTVSGTVSYTRLKPASSANSASPTPVKAVPPFSIYYIALNSTWEPDLWGAVRRSVEAAKAGAQASAAQLAGVRLSSQATLAQDYFQLRNLDADQKLLNEIVVAYQKSLTLVRKKFIAGTASMSDVMQAISILKVAQAEAIDNGVNRAIFEHAIAVLIGQPPSTFCLAAVPLNKVPPPIPFQIPSQLLERRPDIAQAERLVAQANANIGVALSAFFPVLTLTGNRGHQSNHLNTLFTFPSLFWSLGAQLTETIFEGGLRIAKTSQARDVYLQNVASYRQTVLAAFQNVEDNLSTLRILAAEYKVQNEAVAAAKKALQLELNDFSAGTVDYTSVIVAQANAYTAEKNAVDIAGRRMVAAVGLITALGGGWDAMEIKEAGN